MRDKVKRFISILMTALMLVNLMPVGALADGITSGGYQQQVKAKQEPITDKVYVYAKINSGDDTGLIVNGSGWYTLGYISGLNMRSPLEADGKKYKGGKACGYNDPVDARALFSQGTFHHQYNLNIPVNSTWLADPIGNDHGLKACDGADDYEGSDKATWHLNIFIDVQGIKPAHELIFKKNDTSGKEIKDRKSIEGEKGKIVTYNASNAEGALVPEFIEKDGRQYRILPKRQNKNLGKEFEFNWVTLHIEFYYEDIGATRHKITYEPGDKGTFNKDEHLNVEYGQKTPAFRGNLTGQPGWTFAGWDPAVTATVTGNAEYVAQWQEKAVAVTYEAKYGDTTKSLSTQTITAFSADGLTKDVTAPDKTGEGYTFIGWFKGDEQTPFATEKELSKEKAKANLKKDGNNLFEDTTFTAKYESLKATVKYQKQIGNNDPEAIKAQTINVTDGNLPSGDPLEAVSAGDAPAGYQFVGWYKGTKRIATESALATDTAQENLNKNKDNRNLYADTTFTAKFAPNPDVKTQIKYEVYPNQNGFGNVTNGTDNIQAATGEPVGQDNFNGSEARAHNGYTFEGWYIFDADGNNGEKISEEKKLGKDKVFEYLTKDEDNLYVGRTFYAKFVPDASKTATVTYKVADGQEAYGSVDPAGEYTILQATGELVVDGKVKSEEYVPSSTAMANTGYKFVGWYMDGKPIEGTAAKLEGKDNLKQDETTNLYQATVFEARFAPDAGAKVPVTYEAENGTLKGTTSQEAQVVTGEGLTDVEAKPNTGYKFDGWYVVDKNGDKHRLDSAEKLDAKTAKKNLNKDGNLYAETTFIARFVPDENQTVPVIYTTDENGILWGGPVIGSITYNVNIATGKVWLNNAFVDKLEPVPTYPKEGYEFYHWIRVSPEKTIEGADSTLTDEKARPNLNQKDGLYQKTEFKAIFKPQTNLSYTVNYYWNGNHQNPIKSESGTATYGQIVNPKTDVSGYTLMPEQETSLTIGTKENVLNLYYYKNVNLIANSDEKTYDGKPKSVSDYTCEVAKVQEDGTVEYVPWTGEKLTFKFVGAFGSGTDAGDYDVTFKEGSVGENNGLYYVKEVQPGTLTIKPALIKLRAPIASKPYDGTPLKAEDYGYGYEGNTDLADDFKSISVEGSQTMVGNSASSVTYTLKDRKKPQNYDIQCIPGTLTITPATDKVTVTITGNKVTETYDGSVKTASGYGVSTTNEKYTEADFTFTGKAEVKKTDAGTYAMGLKAEQFTNTSANFTNVEFVVTDGSLTINKRPVMLASANLTKVYDGTELKNGETPVTEMFGTEDAFPEGEGVKYTFTGGQTDVGKSANTFTYKPNDNTKEDNYTFEVKFGKLEVTPVTEEVVVTITGHNNTVTYNGSEQSVTGYDVTIPEGSLYTENDFEFTGEASDKTASGTNAQEEAYAMGLKAEHFRNKNTNFKNVTFKITDGWLVINPRAVTLTSSDAEKVYDGQPLTKDEVKVSGDGFAEGEGAEYNVTGSQTDVGESDNTFTYTLNGNTKATNYNIELALGKLEVTPVTEEVIVTITGRTDEMPYDGKEHSVFGFDAKPSNKLYNPKEDMQFNGTDVDMTAKGTDAGQYDIGLTAERFTNKSKTFTNVTFVVTDGYVKINPRAVTLTSETASKTYDGTPLTRPNVTVSTGENEGFVEGEVTDIKATGSVTNAGSVANTITFTPNKETFKEGNYAITKTEGTLTINKRSVLISSQSATKTYDGSALTRPAVTITGDGFVPGELAKAEATGSITKVGSTPNTIQYTTTGAFNAANYSIALSVGTLTVTEKPQPEPRRTFNLTINYVYQNGKRAASSYNRGGLKNGETFDITSPVIAGYTASETVVSGTIYNRDIKVTVIYTADGVNLDDYGVPLGLGNITMNVGDCFE